MTVVPDRVGTHYRYLYPVSFTLLCTVLYHRVGTYCIFLTKLCTTWYCIFGTAHCCVQYTTEHVKYTTEHNSSSEHILYVFTGPRKHKILQYTHRTRLCVPQKHNCTHQFLEYNQSVYFSKYTDKMCTALGFSLQWLSRLEGASKTSFNLCLSSLINCVLIRLHFDCLFEQNESIQTASCHKVWAEEECIHMC